MDFRTFPVQLPSMGPLPMGPLPFSDGNLAWTSGPFQSSFLQWGHCQWGHCLSAMETWHGLPDLSSPASFNGATANGATAFQRWKLGMDFRTFPVQLPSMGPLPMGPLPFSDGNLAWTSGPFQSSFLQWGHCQWGHCLSAMETWHGLPDLSSPASFNGATANGATAFQRWKLGMDFRTFPVQLPSMRPLPFSDGNRSLWLASVMDS